MEVSEKDCNLEEEDIWFNLSEHVFKERSQSERSFFIINVEYFAPEIVCF